MVSDISFTVCVHINKGRWRVAIREQYRGRNEFIVRSDITPVASRHGYLDEVFDVVDDAGWFVDRTSSRRDPELAQMVAGAIPRIPDEATTNRDQYVFVARCMARNVPFSIAQAAWKDKKSDTSDAVTFAEFYIMSTAMIDTPASVEVG